MREEPKRLAGILEVLHYVNQFKIMGVRRPASFLVGAGKDTRAVLNVSSYDVTHVALSRLDGVEVSDSYHPMFRDDAWSELIEVPLRAMSSSPNRHYHVPVGQEQVTVIGFIPRVPYEWHEEGNHGGLEWVEPGSADYLANLTSRVDRSSSIVLMTRRGMVSHIGPILEQAFLVT